MNQNAIDPRLAGVAPPEPPDRLRAAALAAAERVWDARPDFWTRLAASRPLRLAWAAAVLALVASHAAMSVADRRAAARSRESDARTAAPAGAPASLASPAAPELGEVADALRIRITRIQWTGEGRSRRALARPVAAPPSDKEPS